MNLGIKTDHVARLQRLLMDELDHLELDIPTGLATLCASLACLCKACKLSQEDTEEMAGVMLSVYENLSEGKFEMPPVPNWSAPKDTSTTLN